MLVPIRSITIGKNRQRRHFDVGELTDLAGSIASKGLMHALVVRYEGTEILLVSGERRLRAIQDLHESETPFRHDGEFVPSGEAPCVLLTDLDELAYFEAELEENVRRADLTWQEIAAARAALHELRKRQNPAQTIADTAREIFDSVGASTLTKEAIILARHLDDPEVRSAASAREAMRVVERKVRGAENVILAEQAGKIESPHRLFVADWLKHEDEQMPAFDVLLTDPPYGMGADEFGDSGGAAVSEHIYKDDEDTFVRVVIPGLLRAMQLCRPNAHAYVFCDIDRFGILRDMFSMHGWKAFRTPLIWHRPTGRVPIPDYGPRRQYETILFARRGDRKVNYIAPDVLPFPTEENLGMSAQKPVALFEELLKRSARPGDWILDPFCGTGTIIEAAQRVKCRAYAVELSAQTAGIAVGRLNGLSTKG